MKINNKLSDKLAMSRRTFLKGAYKFCGEEWLLMHGRDENMERS